MALFSRRKKDFDETAAEAVTSDAPVVDDADPASAAPEEAVPEVSISVSTYRGAAVPASAPTVARGAAEASTPAAAEAIPEGATRITGTGEAPPQTETIPGMRDNAVVAEALSRVAESATPAQLVNVARQLLQGQLFLRVKGDARTLLAEGKSVPLAVGRSGDDQYVLAFSSGAALRAAMAADGDTDTSAMGQPALNVLQHVIDGPYAGLLLDGASAPARAVLPTAVLETAVRQADPQLRLKTLLAIAPRTPDVAARVAEALTETPFWVAVGTATAPDGSERMGVAEARTTDGRRMLNVFSHPLEIVAMGRSERALPFTGAQLGRALRGDEALSGVLVDAAGPWIALSRDDLAPVLALPDPPAAAPAS